MIEDNSYIANKLEELHPTKFQGNPESGIDQFLNRSISEPTIEELQAKLAGLNNELELMRSRAIEAEDLLRQVRKGIEEVLAGDVDPATTFEEFREAFELLGVKATRQVSIEISVSWRGTIELPLGVEVDDLDVDDFGISIDGHSEYDSDISYYFEDSSIDER